jgi:peroxiredoxin
VVRLAMRRGAVVLLTLLGLGSLGCGGSMGGGGPGAASSSSSGEGAALVGAEAPDFSLSPPGGGAALGPKDFRGKVLIVDFWATWCAPCRESFPAYQKLVDEFGGRLAVIGVSVDEDSSGIEKFRSETGVTFPLVWDEGQGVAGAYKPPTMPTSFIVDRFGIVSAVHEGFHAGDHEALREKVKSLF